MEKKTLGKDMEIIPEKDPNEITPIYPEELPDYGEDERPENRSGKFGIQIINHIYYS